MIRNHFFNTIYSKETDCGAPSIKAPEPDNDGTHLKKNRMLSKTPPLAIIQQLPRRNKRSFEKKLTQLLSCLAKLGSLGFYFMIMSSCAIKDEFKNTKITDLTFYNRDPVYTTAHPATNVTPYSIKNSFVNMRVVPQKYYEYKKTGVASIYGHGDNTHCRLTASGMLFNANAMMAAMRDVPIPCVATVTNLRNGHKVEVLVADRGPYAQVQSRLIDLSYSAAKKLNMLKAGLAPVMVEVNVNKSLRLAGALPSYRERVKIAMREKSRIVNIRIRGGRRTKNSKPIVSPFKDRYSTAHHPFLSMVDTKTKKVKPKPGLVKRVVRIWQSDTSSITSQGIGEPKRIKIWGTKVTSPKKIATYPLAKKRPIPSIKLINSNSKISLSPFKHEE